MKEFTLEDANALGQLISSIKGERLGAWIMRGVGMELITEDEAKQVKEANPNTW